MVSVTDLELQDSVWQWGVWTNEKVANIFKVEEIKKRPYEFPNDIHLSITFELNSDLTVLNRQAYSMLDWLGDIGGLAEALFFLGGFLIAATNFGQLEIMLVQALYKTKQPKQSEDSSNQLIFKSGKVAIEPELTDQDSGTIKKISSCRLLLLKMCSCFICKCCKCCRTSRNERLLS